MARHDAEQWPRVIVHADMDAFYAAIEQLDHPELRGKAVLVGGTGRRGVVTTASYEARPYGVGSAMPMMRARALCPHAIVVPPRFARYTEVSGQIMDVFESFSPVVEPISLDEAFLDLTGSARIFGTPGDIGQKLIDAVYDATGLSVSVGISVTKYVAKVASDQNKPKGLTVVPGPAVRSFLAPLHIGRLWGVGPKAVARLEAHNLRLIGEVAESDPALLEKKLGRLGPHIYNLSRGIDVRRVVSDRTARSVGSERTLEHDVRGREAIIPHLRHSADEIARRLRRKSRKAKGVRVKLKTTDFKLHSRQTKMRRATDNANELLEAAEALLDGFDLRRPCRLVGLAAFDIELDGTATQGELFTDAGVQQKSRLDRTVDSVLDRFGNLAIRRASDLEQ